MACHGGWADEDLWDAYDKMGLGFWQHAVDSECNALYDGLEVLVTLGPVTGRRVLMQPAPPGSTWFNCSGKEPRSPPLTQALSWSA